MHCWPSPRLAMSEISRVLKPGGVFVFSTILNVIEGIQDIFGKEALEQGRRVFSNFPGNSIATFYEQDLQELCTISGLEEYERIRK